jgi:hypothetical protein
MFHKIKNYLNKYTNIQLLLKLYLVKIFIYLTILLVFKILGAEIKLSTTDLSSHIIYRNVFLYAFVETLICQFLIIEILLRYKIALNSIVIISGLMFAFAHYQNIVYIIYAIPFGFLYAITYLIFRERMPNQKAVPFLAVFLMHFLWNLTMVFF